MELGQLEAFLAVVREGSFTNAAAKLNLTQPSLSARIQQLEHSLGVSLFLRDRRPVQLTPLGKIFIDYAERALGILDAGRTAVHAAKAGDVGRVTVCCPFSLASTLMPEVVNRFGQAHPQVELSIEAGHSDFAVSQLTDGVVNLALAAAFPRFATQTRTLLRLHDEMVAAVSPEHKLADSAAVPLASLWTSQIIVIHWGAAFDAYLESLRQMSIASGSLVRVPLAAALPMAQLPNSVTFLPRRLTAVSGLVELDVPEFKFDWDAILMTRRERELTELEQSFVDIVAAVWHSGRQSVV
ncbi:MAG: LysR family transcriptional regulator [Chloroflexi bacterium]|nr:LysR family transcriptional regulator [Chloroflexota bacterium]